jgi:hypothetical protein
MSRPEASWTISLSEVLKRYQDDPEWSPPRTVESADVPVPPEMDAYVALVMPTETPAAGLLDPVGLIDRAFRWAARSIERGESVQALYEERARPIPPRDGLIVRDVEGGESALLYLELSKRIYDTLTSGPVAFIFALIAVLELLGIHVRVRIYRDPSPGSSEREDTADYDLQPREPPPMIVYNYAPTVIVHVHESSIQIETDEAEAHAIESRERGRVELELQGRPVRRRGP